MVARPLIFEDDPTRHPRLFACSDCGTLHSPHDHLTDGRPDAEKARLAADDCLKCLKVEPCIECGVRIAQGMYRCGPCDRAGRQAAMTARIGRAEETPIEGPCFGASDGDFYHDVESAADAGETVVFGSTFRVYRADIASIVEGITDDHHEDASENDLNGLSAFYDAMEIFNDEQTDGSYDMNDKIRQTIPQRRTFAMIKPDATERGVQDDMIADMVAAGFRVTRQTMRTIDRKEAEWLYREHEHRDHFTGLVDYTISGPVVLLLLESDHDDTATAFRALMGPTDRTKASPGTLRARYAVGYRENSIHGSDSAKAAVDEICHFFPYRYDEV